ncbi:MAG: 2Fe-2S iron-sulfur cluster-binding protein [Bacteriovoracia bacterium]
MGGSNPYIQNPSVKTTEVTEDKFIIEFVSQNEKLSVEVDPNNPPTSGSGQPGSILDIALASGVDIDHACGGVCACSTCHVYVKQGLETCSQSTEDEEDQLDKAPGVSPSSRLACQCIPSGKANLVVEVPNWNRNLARE